MTLDNAHPLAAGSFVFRQSVLGWLGVLTLTGSLAAVLVDAAIGLVLGRGSSQEKALDMAD